MSKLILDSGALERLLGGDTELEVKIRTDVANQFADKYLKSLVSSLVMEKTKIQVDELVTLELGIRTRVLVQRYKTAVQNTVIETVLDMVKAEIKESLDTNHYKQLIDNFVEQESNRIVSEWTAGNIQDRINKAADEKIKQKLGI